MRLSTLEIKGFKSFADKTVIHFNRDITGIVGPNGCGKSNIVDAIRWVLGEQKPTTLRSDKMENLIFNGTRKRRSSSVAEVSLTFDNTKNILPTEYDKVTVSRVYYRNGESEYRLNNVTCRLKDIINLFMDTGIGSDSYAIIELKMIDQILNDKENSRRKLFEQAAGIEKYKSRMRETLLKIKGTDADLERVKDLLYEIETNLKTLESQANKTRRYQKLKEKYKNLSIELAVLLLSDQKEIYDRINTQLESESDRKLQVETEINQLQADLQQLKAGSLEKEKNLQAVQKKLNEHNSYIQQLENERSLIREKKRYLEERNKNLLAQEETSRQRLEALEKSISELEEKAQAARTNLEKVQQEQYALQGKLEESRSVHAGKKDHLTREKEVLEAIEKSIYDYEKQIAVNRVQAETLLAELEQTGKKKSDSQETLEQINRELDALQKEESRLEEELQKLAQEEEKRKEALEATEALAEKLRHELTSVNRELDARKNEYQLTRNLVENLEGFPESIKFLRKEARYTRQAPLLSDIITTRDEYKIAIENFLEPYLNYYIVNNLEEAVFSVNLLSESSRGRAHFFILNEFEQYKPHTFIPDSQGIPALEVIETEPKYEKLVAYLLDRVCLVESLDDIGTQKDDSIIYLARSGKFIRQKYALSGGSVGLFEGKRLGRARNLEKLEKTIKKLEQQALEISNKLQQQEQKTQKLQASDQSREVERLRNDLNEKSRRVIELKTRKEHILQSLTDAEGLKDHALKQVREFEKANRDLEARLADLKQQQQAQQSLLSTLEEEFAVLDTSLNQLTFDFNQATIGMHRQESQLNSILQEIRFNKAQMEETRQSLDRSREEQKSNQEKILGFDQKAKSLEEEVLKAYEKMEVLEEDVRKAESAWYGTRGRIDELETKIRNLNQRKEQSNLLISELKEKMNTLKLDLASLKERLMIEFKVDINDLLDREPDPKYELDTLRAEVEKVKYRLDNFGEINPMAVEAYEEMKKRYDFISSQRDDLLQARENLMATIRELNETATTRFMEAFEKIQHHFREVFRTLFNEEDTCELKLLEPDKPLDSKIQIIARPKGKRPKLIDQLSQGEKSLTAIALLFALYLVKPAPFCIFDEVDAPLDDVNVSKFVEIVRKFSKDSQFILVTHNKKTMSEVDAIYGVTMMETGISKVVPVDFAQMN